MYKENCRGVRCTHCINDDACCNGEYQLLIDETLCNNCRYADICYETHFPVVGCSVYAPDVPLAALAPRHIGTNKLSNHFSSLSLRFKGRCK